MTFTPIAFGTQSWHTPLNAALQDLQDQINDWQIINVVEFGAAGDGTTDDTTAIQAALDAAYTDSATVPQGRTVYLPAGTFRISAPLTIPPYVTLRGPYAMRGTNIQKSIIKPMSTFSGTAVLTMVSAASGGYLTRSEGQRFVDITIDGDVLPGTTTGILATGDVHGVVMHNVSIDAVTDRGVQTVTDGSGNPFSWYLNNVQVSTATLDGFRLASATDSTLIDCRAIGCGRHGYYVSAMANSIFTDCRSEFSGQQGWNIADSWGTGTGSGGAVWNGCTTDRSERNGFLITATGSATLQFNGIVCRRDGRNANGGGGGYAGFAASSATAPVQVDGLVVYPGVDDDGTGTNSPQIGFISTGSTWVSLGSGYLHAQTTAFTDGGTNTFLQRGPGVGLATGSTTAPTRSATEPWNFAGPVTVTQGGYLASRGASTNAALEAQVTGDSVTRWNVQASGDTSWGSGSATRDITLGRSAANTLSLTTANLRIATAGRGLQVAEGANAKMGTAVLVAGAVTVATTAVTANSRIYLTSQVDGGTPGFQRVSARVAATSFTITSSNAADTSTVAWMIVEPA
jgi:hypothetical protein